MARSALKEEPRNSLTQHGKGMQQLSFRWTYTFAINFILRDAGHQTGLRIRSCVPLYRPISKNGFQAFLVEESVRTWASDLQISLTSSWLAPYRDIVMLELRGDYSPFMVQVLEDALLSLLRELEALFLNLGFAEATDG